MAWFQSFVVYTLVIVSVLSFVQLIGLSPQLARGLFPKSVADRLVVMCNPLLVWVRLTA